MFAELAQYCYPKRKAIEVGGIDDGGGPVEVTHRVVFVDPPKQIE
jgi:hypothetical protein